MHVPVTPQARTEYGTTHVEHDELVAAHFLQQLVGLEAVGHALRGRRDEDLDALLAHLGHHLVDHRQRRQVHLRHARRVNDHRLDLRLRLHQGVVELLWIGRGDRSWGREYIGQD
jgi:hypothetical protein